MQDKLISENICRTCQMVASTGNLAAAAIIRRCNSSLAAHCVPVARATVPIGADILEHRSLLASFLVLLEFVIVSIIAVLVISSAVVVLLFEAVLGVDLAQWMP